jgi:crotonobetainyl-CoA:carnitine CoA-transferase CaiB-like acyl-CoA transferase
VIVATGNDAQFRRFCVLLGLPALAEDPAYATNAQRVEAREALAARLSEGTRRFAMAGLLAACEAQGVPAGPINDMAAVFADGQVQARGLRIDRDGVPGVRAPITLDGRHAASDLSAPRLGDGAPDWLSPR